MIKRGVNYENVIEDFKNGTNTRDLCQKYNQKLTNIQRIIREYGNVSKEFSEKLKVLMSELYISGKTPKEISVELNIKISRVYKYLISISLLKDKRNANKIHSCNSSFFYEINSFDKAYFLGLLYADGCNTRNGLSISLVEKDKYILEILKDKLQFTGDLGFKPKREESHSNQYCLQVTDKNLSNNLSLMGCIPNKSLILKFPTEEQVPSHLLNHFIRGYFDGDGCIFNPQNKYNSISFVSTYNFIEVLKTHFIKTLNILNNKIQIKDNKITATVNWSSLEDTKKIMNYMYKDSNGLYLKRKYEKFKNL